ncbi:MAG: M48 family metalloprotease [Acidobacteria bacterium]|nr:M48 family metalloprotease [Acidobacteriota bacterium]
MQERPVTDPASLRVVATRLAPIAALLALAIAPVAAGDLKSLTTPQELVLGQIFAEQVDQQYPLLHDPVLTWYVNLRGRQFADRSPRNNLPYFFRVIDSPEINAFAIPGGHIYLNLGVLQVADEEGELLGILAHEIGHIVGRHSAKQIVKQQWASILMTTARGAYYNPYADLAANLFGELGFLKMTRDAEREADQIGFQLMIDAGYDPVYMIAMFEKLQQRYKEQPGLLEKLFLTHPPTDERIANLKTQLIATRPPEGLRVTSPEFQETRLRVRDRYPAPPPKGKDTRDKDGKGQ